LLFLILIFISGYCYAGEGCFTIVVGRDASVDGSVIMAHNEDDSPPQVVNHYKVPRQKYEDGETFKLLAGGEIPQIPSTLSYIWSEMPGLRFSDSFLNEAGVCVTSDNCPSREDNPEITDGGITKMLRHLIAQRASTALMGVKLAGELVEQFGYGASGRTYIISDPNEGWLFAVVRGKHWLAARVPDDHAAMIANTYTIHNVDLSDTLNYRASADIIEYAVERGWHDPDAGDFDFAAAYANPEVAVSGSNYYRQWAGLNHLSASPMEASPQLPFSIVPKKKVGIHDLMAILRDHYEETELEVNGNPHENPISTICGRATQTSFIAQLRGDMPEDIGLVYRVSLGPPCGSVYIPFYFGISAFPEGYVWKSEQPSAGLFREKVNAPFKADKSAAFWTFSNFFYKMDANYKEEMNSAQASFKRLEKEAAADQDSIESIAQGMIASDQDGVEKLLSDFSKDVYLKALQVMEEEIAPEEENQ